MLAPVTFRYMLRLRCETEPGTEVLLPLLPARTRHQQLAMERLAVRGAAARSVFTDAARLAARRPGIEAEPPRAAPSRVAAAAARAAATTPRDGGATAVFRSAPRTVSSGIVPVHRFEPL